MARHGVGGLVFVGLMFLGAGVGLLVGHTGAGALIGMGLGFIAMALLRGGAEEKGAEATPRPPPLLAGGWGAIPLLGLGAIFTAIGIALLLGLALPWKTVGALFTVLMGLAFLWWGISLLRAKASQS